MGLDCIYFGTWTIGFRRFRFFKVSATTEFVEINFPNFYHFSQSKFYKDATKKLAIFHKILFGFYIMAIGIFHRLYIALHHSDDHTEKIFTWEEI